jgi:hypothetical protein
VWAVLVYQAWLYGMVGACIPKPPMMRMEGFALAPFAVLGGVVAIERVSRYYGNKCVGENESRAGTLFG